MKPAKYDVEHPTTHGFAVHHIQLTAPPGSEPDSRHFWVDQLGFLELEKPPALQARGGIWVRADDLEIHIGIEQDFRPAKKAHPGITVHQIDALAQRLTQAGTEVTWDSDFPGRRRFYIVDNAGNRIEFLEAVPPAPPAW